MPHDTSDLPRLPHKDGTIREDVSIKQLSEGEQIDTHHSMSWWMAIGEIEDSLMAPPEKPDRFADMNTEEIGRVTIGDCTKEEILDLLVYFNYSRGRIDEEDFNESRQEREIDKESAVGVKESIEAVDEDFLETCPDDYSDVGQLPASLVDSITGSTYTKKVGLGSNLNLNAVAIALGLDQVTNSPDAFAGLFYQPRSELLRDKLTAVIFGSGVVICFANNRDDTEQAERLIRENLAEAGLV